MRRSTRSRLPARPLHLYSEFISAEHDGTERTRGSVMLHMEFESATISVPLYLDIPDGEGCRAAIHLTSEEDAACRDELILRGYALFILKGEDVLSIARGLKPVKGTRRPSEADILAWAILRVKEYILSRGDTVSDILIHDTVTGGESARLAALCDEGLSCAQSC